MSSRITISQVINSLPQDSFFRDWMECWPVSEPPKSYILFSALGMMGAVLGKRVWLEHDQKRVLPMLNILLIGPSGIGKTTALCDMGLKLLNIVPAPEQPQVINGATTTERLMDDLAFNPHTLIVAEELAAFFTKKKYQEDLIPKITEALNYLPMISRRTKGGGIVNVHNPQVIVMGGSTVDWLQDQLPDTATSGGFLARFLIVKEDEKAQKVADPQSSLTPKQWATLRSLRERVFTDFYHCTLHTRGPVAFADYEARDEYSFWYQNYEPETGLLSPFAARAGEMILRLAILVALSAMRGVLVADDIRAAINLYEYTAQKLQEVVVPRTAQGKLLQMVLDAVGGSATEDAIMRAMRNSSSAQEVQKLLQSLMLSKEVRYSDGRYHRIH